MTYNIVNIRGTSGSGKTTVLRKILDELHGAGRQSFSMEEDVGGRRRVVATEAGGLVLMGRYDATCGGCDTMSWKGAADDVCRLVQRYAERHNVAFEGLMVSGWGTGRLRDLWEALDKRLTIIQLTTSLEDCLASVNARRQARAAAKGQEAKPLNPENTVAKWHGTMRGSELLVKAGVPVEFLDRDAAHTRARGLLL